MTDRELLEAAAKAAGLCVESYYEGAGLYVRSPIEGGYYWSPLTDDGDALRLLAKLRLDVLWAEHAKGVLVSNSSYDGTFLSSFVKSSDDLAADVRISIVRAAAAMAAVPADDGA